MRIGGVDGLQLDQRLRILVGAAHHRAHRCDLADLSLRSEELQFLRRRLALHQRERDVAAEDDAALYRDALGQARARPS